MEGRTQLMIAGVEVVLPSGFATTVKRENSFFTKNGEYTYDCTLRLDNQTNRELYGFLHRLNKKDAVASKRSAVLIADGRVYCRGTEVITGWTDDDVTIQIVSGNSELNYFIGNDLKIEWLDLGEIQGDVAAPFRYNGGLASNPTYPTIDYCLPTVYNAADGACYNNYLARGKFGDSLPTIVVGSDNLWYDEKGRADLDVVAQPFLCALVRRLVLALGYTIGTNHLEETQFKDLFVVNTRKTMKYAEMLSGWTVKDFLEEVENLTGVVFLTDNVSKTVDILQKSQYYANPRIIPLQNVVDEYNLDIDEEGTAEWSNSDISYDLPDDNDHRLLRLPESLKQNTRISEGNYPFNGRIFDNPYSRREILRDASTARLFILIPNVTDKDFAENRGFMSIGGDFPPIDMYDWDAREHGDITAIHYYSHINIVNLAKGTSGYNPVVYGKNRFEVDLFADLKRENASGEVQLKIRPAVMKLMPSYMYYKTLQQHTILMYGLTNIIVAPGTSNASGKTVEVDEDSCSVSEEELDFVDVISNYQEESESSAGDLCVAFYGGLQQHRHCYLPQAYTDAWHAQNMEEFWHEKEDNYPLSVSPRGFSGSLRLQDIDAEVFGGVYRVDTTRKVTFTTYDPNLLDPRSIIVVRNRRWVVREVEETLTAQGRKPSWKVTCHPIEISDTAAESRWVLTRGVWDDGGAWLDDGRWND